MLRRSKITFARDIVADYCEGGDVDVNQIGFNICSVSADSMMSQR